jgi:hypothetical protein
MQEIYYEGKEKRVQAGKRTLGRSKYRGNDNIKTN